MTFGNGFLIFPQKTGIGIFLHKMPNPVFWKKKIEKKNLDCRYLNCTVRKKVKIKNGDCTLQKWINLKVPQSES